MLTLRCAVGGGTTVSSVRVTLPEDATVRDLQRALAASSDLQMSGDGSDTDESGNCVGFRGDAEDTHAHLGEGKTTTTPRLFFTKTYRQRERGLHEDGRWLQMNDSALHVLLASAHDSSSSSSSMGDTAAASAASDADAVRREYLSPERELLPHTKLLEVFGDVEKADKSDAYTAAGGASAATATTPMHVLVVFQTEATATATMSTHTLQSSPSDDARRAATSRIHNARAFACSPVRQKRRRCADSSKWSADSATASAGDPRTDPDSDSGGVCANDRDASVFVLCQDKDASDFSDNKVDDDTMGMPPTHDPYLLRLLRPQYDAAPRERYELRPAPVSDTAVAVLLNRLARVEAEYGAVLSRAGRRKRCLALLFAAVCALFPRGHEPELRTRVGIPGDDLRVLATFDFTLQHGDTHVGVVVAKPQADRRCPHRWCQYRRKQQLQQPHEQQLCSHCDGDDDDEEEEEESGDERESQQSRRQRQAREHAAMEHALQHNWLGAEVLANTARAKPPRVVFGVVTSYRKWVFLRYDGMRVQAHEATLQLASGGVVPLRTSVAEITGLVAQMLLEGGARASSRPSALRAAATGTEQTGGCRVS